MEKQEVLQMIEAQQKKLSEKGPAFCVGEQLKDIVRAANQAEVDTIGADLKNEGMGIADAESKIRAFASGNKTGTVGFCGPADAERIIRKFYGLADAPAAATPAPQAQPAKRKTISLADFL